MAKEDKKFSTVPLNWNEVYYTNCPLVSASNIDQELGWNAFGRPRLQFPCKAH